MTTRRSSSPVCTRVELINLFAVGTAQALARRVAAQAGASKALAARFALAVSEAATNAVKYAGRGNVELRFSPAEGALEFEVIDQGPGISDLSFALEDGHSQARSLGLGLGAIRRLTDECAIDSGPGGTRVWGKLSLSKDRG